MCINMGTIVAIIMEVNKVVKVVSNMVINMVIILEITPIREAVRSSFLYKHMVTNLAITLANTTGVKKIVVLAQKQVQRSCQTHPEALPTQYHGSQAILQKPHSIAINLLAVNQSMFMAEAEQTISLDKTVPEKQQSEPVVKGSELLKVLDCTIFVANNKNRPES